jgi:hypothetical protein
MSRSKHTDPRAIRARRRLAAPFQPRSAGDLRLRRERGQQESDAAAELSQATGKPELLRPRILIQTPNAGFYHPATKSEILEVLENIGPVVLYGLRSVELVRARAGKAGALIFGGYESPGRVLLYEQATPPWRLPGMLRGNQARRFKRAGAIITTQRDTGTTLVDWPADSLKQYMLEEVLLHELGHHVLQHEGKRPGRIARTRDHEVFAAQFVVRYKSQARLRRLRVA